jgi:hypothetical protein
MVHGWLRRVIALTLVSELLVACGDPGIGPLKTNGIADKVALRRSIADLAYLERVDSGAVDAVVVVMTLNDDSEEAQGVVLAAMTDDRGLLSPTPAYITSAPILEHARNAVGLLAELGRADLDEKQDTLVMMWPADTVRIAMTEVIPTDVVSSNHGSDTLFDQSSHVIELPGKHSNGLVVQLIDQFTSDDSFFISRPASVQTDSGLVHIERSSKDVQTTILTLRRSYYEVHVSSKGKRIGVLHQSLYRYDIRWL